MNRLMLTFLALTLTATNAFSQEARPADETLLGEAADLKLPVEAGLDDRLAGAAASWYRRLAALDADERFENLNQWSMPTQARRTKITSCISPDLATISSSSSIR